MSFLNQPSYDSLSRTCTFSHLSDSRGQSQPGGKSLSYKDVLAQTFEQFDSDISMLKQVFVNVGVGTQEEKPKTPAPRESDSKRKCYNLLENRPRTQSKQSIDFQNKFAQCLQQVIGEEESDNRALCLKVVDYLKNNDSLVFWRQLTRLLPEKTTIQLREYFQNSFKRFMYREFITQEDKAVLQDLMAQMAGSKPADIASRFLEMTQDRNYFKRNVVMYVVNMKDK
ncbi:Hypothetical_protein [Hexamita inflata]|uniref:Hypothetical_protein n=1 Tax=Hexamita inflata TaxID=28002 RepID=A0AA86RBP4_9EUKA|nr:Hypothetical protein HINF_LOCUS62120 [Hexamita inflata]